MVYSLTPFSCDVNILHSNSSSALTPSITAEVKLGLTATYIFMYSLLFFIVYVQLWMILWYGYKRISFQAAFLFFCAIWSALRTTLFSFYINDTRMANRLPFQWYWLLYSFPVCLQFFTLCLLNLYFSQVMFKARPQYAAHPNKYKYILRIFCLIMSLVFLSVNIGCAVIVHGATSADTLYSDTEVVSKVKLAVELRVVVNGLLFVIVGAWLAYCIVRISKATSANILLEARGTSVCQASTVGVLVILLYTSRVIYNFLAISPLRCQNKISAFNFDWYNVSDQADLVDLTQFTYVLFGIVLFVWELLPTSLVVFFFRVRPPVQSMVIDNTLNSQSYNSRVYFFDNPHRYDSDDESGNIQSNTHFKDGNSSASSLPRFGSQDRTIKSQSSHGLHSSFSPCQGTGSYCDDPYRHHKDRSPNVLSQ